MKVNYKDTKEYQDKINALLAKLPRCIICKQVVLSKADKSKPSELVEWLGEMWTKKHPQMMRMYESLPPGALCSYCESLKKGIRIGRES